MAESLLRAVGSMERPRQKAARSPVRGELGVPGVTACSTVGVVGVGGTRFPGEDFRTRDSGFFPPGGTLPGVVRFGAEFGIVLLTVGVGGTVAGGGGVITAEVLCRFGFLENNLPGCCSGGRLAVQTEAEMDLFCGTGDEGEGPSSRRGLDEELRATGLCAVRRRDDDDDVATAAGSSVIEVK